MNKIVIFVIMTLFISGCCTHVSFIVRNNTGKTIYVSNRVKNDVRLERIRPGRRRPIETERLIILCNNVFRSYPVLDSKSLEAFKSSTYLLCGVPIVLDRSHRIKIDNPNQLSTFVIRPEEEIDISLLYNRK